MDRLETKDLILRKAVFSDWEALYRNIWRHWESAKYMVWNVTESEESARSRMERTMAFQAAHDYHWTVVEKASGEAMGWAGMEETKPGIWSETGIALGPDFTGKGYGGQILNAMTDLARELGGKRFHGCARIENLPSQKLQLRCGFTHTHSEEAIHHRDGVPCVYEHYEKEL